MVVPPEWPRELPAKVSLIGEAPAEFEEIQGRPFVGRSGKFLNYALRQVGLSRWDCHVTNVFQTRLPGDAVENIGLSRRDAYAALREWEAETGNAHPYRDHVLTAIAKASYLHPATVLECLDRLKLELDKANPNIVVALGGTAAWAIFGVSGSGTISRIRGSLQTEVLTGRKATATYHPAYILRSPKMRPHLLSDLSRACEEAAAGPELDLAERQILVPESPSEVAPILRQMLGRLVSVDIETSHRQINNIAFSPSNKMALSIPIFDKRTRRSYWPTPEAELAVVNSMALLLEDPNTPKLFQYGQGYDIQWLYEHWRICTMGEIHDTRLMAHAMQPDLDKDLATLGATHERLGPWKLMRRAKGGAKRDD